MLAGNIVALLSHVVFIPILTFVFGRQRFEWESMKEIRKRDSDLAKAAHIDLELTLGATQPLRGNKRQPSKPNSRKPRSLPPGDLAYDVSTLYPLANADV